MVSPGHRIDGHCKDNVGAGASHRPFNNPEPVADRDAPGLCPEAEQRTGGRCKRRDADRLHHGPARVAEKADSQDICFVPTGRYSDIVERLTPSAALPGDIVHIDGRVLGVRYNREASDD